MVKVTLAQALTNSSRDALTEAQSAARALLTAARVLLFGRVKNEANPCPLLALPTEIKWEILYHVPNEGLLDETQKNNVITFAADVNTLGHYDFAGFLKSTQCTFSALPARKQPAESTEMKKRTYAMAFHHCQD